MSNLSIVAIDVGNTRIKFGHFEAGRVSEPEELPTKHGRVRRFGLPRVLHVSAQVISATVEPSAQLKEWYGQHVKSQPRVIIVAGSDPDTRDRLLQDWPITEVVPRTVKNHRDIPVELSVNSPDKVGIDRLLNAYAAVYQTLSNRAMIIVDSGTATTVDLVTTDGVFQGGSILPGLRLSARALHEYTARLPLVDVDRELEDLPTMPGKDTIEAIEAGLFFGQLGAVRELIAQLREVALEYGDTLPPEVWITGGGGRQLAGQIAKSNYIDSLALHGLAMLGFDAIS